MKKINMVRKKSIDQIFEKFRVLNLESFPFQGSAIYDSENNIVAWKYDFDEKQIISWKNTANDANVKRIFEVNEARNNNGEIFYKSNHYFAGHIGTIYGGKPIKLTIHLNSLCNISLIVELYKRWFIDCVSIKDMTSFLKYLTPLFRKNIKYRKHHSNYKTRKEKFLKRMKKV